MKQIFKLFAVVFFLLTVSTLTNAQTNEYNVLDIKKIASMLIAEKASGQMDDTPFLAYLNSLGFKKDQKTGFYKYENGREKPILVTTGKEDNRRLFKLYSDHTICWYLFCRVQQQMQNYSKFL